MNLELEIFFSEKSRIPMRNVLLSHGLSSPDFSLAAALRDGSFAGYFSDETGMLFAALYKSNINFSYLPIAGKLPLVNQIHLEDLVLVLASAHFPTVPDALSELKGRITEIDKGALFSTALHLPDATIPIKLLMSMENDQTLLRAETDNAEPEGLRGLSGEVEINRIVGPFSLRKLRFSYKSSLIWLGLDSGFSMGGLAFTLDGLAIGYDTRDNSCEFALEGMTLGLNTGPLQLSGGFLRKDVNTYAGSLSVRVGEISVMVSGAYTAATPETPVDSIFAFGLLRAAIGGPPVCFITGIALGFGYNRSLPIPPIQQLEAFPLLAAVNGNAGWLNDAVTQFAPSAGEYWVAAGILFTSFKMIDSVAILTASWGEKLRINLIARSVLNIPFGVQKTPVAHAVLLVSAGYDTEEQCLAVRAMLANESYIFSEKCRLSGEFAFYTWFGGIHSGDFVLSLGGYHPRYQKPAHYPAVKRLGFSWPINSDLSAWGDIYFALTPSCLMAGGSLHLHYNKGIVDASFDAVMDLFFQWKPYRYDIAISIYLRCRVDLLLFPVNLELGCSVNLWGPEFAGIAHVSLYCIKFDIHFGSSGALPETSITLSEFVESFLPASPDGAAEAYGGCVVRATKGILNEFPLDAKEPDGAKVHIVSADTLCLLVKSPAPVELLSVNDTAADIPVYHKATSINSQINGREEHASEASGARAAFFASAKDAPATVSTVDRGCHNYLRPCGSEEFCAELRVTITRSGGSGDFGTLMTTAVNENLPSGIWAHRDNTAEIITACTGVNICPAQLRRYVNRAVTGLVTTHQEFRLPQISPPRTLSYPGKDAFALLTQINPYDRNGKSPILDALGVDPSTIRLSGLRAHPEQFFIDRPVLAALGG